MLLSASGAMAQTVTVTPVAFSSYATNHADQFEFSICRPILAVSAPTTAIRVTRSAGQRRTRPNPAAMSSATSADPAARRKSVSTRWRRSPSRASMRIFTRRAIRTRSVRSSCSPASTISPLPTSAASPFPALTGPTSSGVRSTFASQTYQYFRFRAQDVQAFLGGRVVEIDAISGTATPGAVPEPGSWAMMIAGFALVGAAARAVPIAACRSAR